MEIATKYPSVRANIITRRTYCRPCADGMFETWEMVVNRVIRHQGWLWARATNGSRITEEMKEELDELRGLLLDRKVSLAGRTLWLGDTDVAKKHEASQFNCAFTNVETVHDVVDVLWLLLQGCGVGFKPRMGTLNGFSKYIPEIKIIRSKRTTKGGDEHNEEKWNRKTKTWEIKVGDSAEAWAKSIGKILAGKYRADKLVLDFSEIRPAGERLAGYGWISQGDLQISNAYVAICEIMNKRAGQLLTVIDILDIVNWLGTILSSRRSSEICLLSYDHPEWETFARAKHNYWENNIQREQSNNSLVFYKKPSKEELQNIFKIMQESGGSEPGFINGASARKRAPWFAGVNPCAEILLPNKSFCNLTEVDISKFKGDHNGLERAIYLAARANYRQTLVNLDDGILQRSWHENNEFLRLCGVGITGIVRRPDLSAYDFTGLNRVATHGAYSMADECDSQRPKNVTTIKPSGTLSKIMDTTEGIHKPLGKYIFNNVNFSKYDPMIHELKAAGYKVIDHPTESSSVLVTFPVMWDDVDFDEACGVPVNLESAVDQLERYKLMLESYVDHNCSITVSYSRNEIPSIIEWLHTNWDSYIGVSWLPRTDPTQTAADLGYKYLPQEVVTKEMFEEYVNKLEEVDLSSLGFFLGEDVDDPECATGVCPVK